MEPIIGAEVVEQPVLSTNPTIKEYAIAFINGMGETQKNRFKKMLENGINCGMSIADNYGVDYDDFITEVKKQMGVMV